MKIRFCAALLLAALALSFLAGCSVNAAPFDAAREAVESRIGQAASAIADPAAPNASASHAQPQVSGVPLLTKEEAEKIALEHAGFTAGQVQRLRTELDYERGMPEYDVDFRVDRFEYDYEIDAQTGKILDWDKDSDD